MQREAKARYLQMLHQSVALSSKVMLRDVVNARTLRLNDLCTLGEMAFTDLREGVNP
jgi:hypothetical protein